MAGGTSKDCQQPSHPDRTNERLKQTDPEFDKYGMCGVFNWSFVEPRVNVERLAPVLLLAHLVVDKPQQFRHQRTDDSQLSVLITILRCQQLHTTDSLSDLLRSASRQLLDVPRYQLSCFARRAFFCVRHVGLELTARVSERPGRRQKQF